jgi:hypothetical protein
LTVLSLGCFVGFQTGTRDLHPASFVLHPTDFSWPKSHNKHFCKVTRESSGLPDKNSSALSLQPSYFPYLCPVFKDQNTPANRPGTCGVHCPRTRYMLPETGKAVNDYLRNIAATRLAGA